MNTADYLLATGSPDDVVLVDGAQSYTYAELRRAVAALAAALAARELVPGSRVGILGPNSLFWLAGYLAAMKLGHVAVPFSTALPAADLRRNAELVNCAAVVADRRSLAQARAAFDADRLITDDAVAAWSDAQWPDGGPAETDADAALMFTSGSTGRPKVVRVTHRNLQANTGSILSYLQLERTDRVLVVLPFFYCYGASLLHTSLRAGARLVLCNSFAFPEVAVTTMQREACTVFAGVPSTFQLLLRASSFGRRELPQLRIIQQAGGRLAPTLIQELLAVKPQARLFVMYGQTEATARLSYLPPELLPDKLGSIGKGLPGVELRVLDDAGSPVPPGVRGEIFATGANISPGYLDDPVSTASKFTPWGLRTGDLAVVDDDGFLFVVGRREDFIKSWGHRISGSDVELCALSLDGVVAAAAVGVPHDEAGEAVALFVETRQGTTVTPDDVFAHCRSRLPSYMAPRVVRIVEGLPLTANGKVDKVRLSELASGSAAPLKEVADAAATR